MMWNWDHNDEHTVCLQISDKQYIVYRIFRYHRIISDNTYNGPWAIYRAPDPDNFTDGYLGEWKNKVGIVCGGGLACAIGLPNFALFKNEDYEKCQKICEIDFDNLKNKNDIVLIENNDFKKEHMVNI